MQELDLLRVAIAIIFFVYASVSDWRTRKVKDKTWVTLGTIALMILAMDLVLKDAPLIAFSLLLPIAFLFYDIFWDREKELNKPTGLLGVILYVAAFGWMVYIGYTIVTGSTEWTEEINGPFIAFFVMVLFEMLYMFDIIKGGADAKAVISIAILFPWYPAIASGLPMIVPGLEGVLTFFPFALSVLFIGAVVSIFLPLYFLMKNVRAREKISGRSFIGFKMPVNEVEKHFVWLIEWVDEGKPKFSARKPRESETLKSDLSALKALGMKEVWVTYKIPFIIPLTIAIIVVLILGNPLFALY